MKFDKRNPFAAWGHEQEIYTMNGENETIKFEEKGFTSLIDTTNDELFVNAGEHKETAGKFTTPQDQVFFTNNENMNETLYSAKRMVAGEDIVRNTNEELPMNGIHADDWKLYDEAEESENEETEVEETEETEVEETEGPEGPEVEETEETEVEETENN